MMQCFPQGLSWPYTETGILFEQCSFSKTGYRSLQWLSKSKLCRLISRILCEPHRRQFECFMGWGNQSTFFKRQISLNCTSVNMKLKMSKKDNFHSEKREAWRKYRVLRNNLHLFQLFILLICIRIVSESQPVHMCTSKVRSSNCPLFKNSGKLVCWMYQSFITNLLCSRLNNLLLGRDIFWDRILAR